MSTTKRTNTIIMSLILACVLVSSAMAERLDFQQNLSKEITIRLNNVTFVEALDKIGKEAGVKFVLSSEAEWKLPYGVATRLSAVLDGPLSDSMTEMLNAFFMRYAVGDQELTIYPRAELEHIIGRPTTRQLQLLKDIYTKPIKVYKVDKLQETLNLALKQDIFVSPMDIQGQLNNLLRQLVAKDPIYRSSTSPRNRMRPPIRSTTIIKEATATEPGTPEPTEIELPTPVTIVQLLKQVRPEGSSSNAEWYLARMDFGGQTPEIRIVSKTALKFFKRQQKIDIFYKDESLDKIFRGIASRGGVTMTISNLDNLRKLRMSVNMQNISIEQALRNIADMAGLDYGFDHDYVMSIAGPKSVTPTPPTKKAPATTSSGYVGKVSIPMDGGKYFIEFMLRENDLTDELKKLRNEKMKSILGAKDQPAKKPADKTTR